MAVQYKGTGAVDVGAWTAPMKTQRKYAGGGYVESDDGEEEVTTRHRHKKHGGGGRSKTFSDPDVQMIAALSGTQSETPQLETPAAAPETPDLSGNIEE